MGKRLQLGAGVLLLVGALLLAACGNGTPSKNGSPSSSSTANSGTSITISNFMFSPMSLTVSPGSTIKVTNKDSAAHTLTANGGQFNTGNIAQNQTKTFKAPSKAGTYHYICSIHQYMMGTIVVK